MIWKDQYEQLEEYEKYQRSRCNVSINSITAHENSLFSDAKLEFVLVGIESIQYY
jgi:hypothetical protein